MEVVERSLGCLLLSNRRLDDNRGWFQIDFSIADLHAHGIAFDHVEQLNHSYTEHAGVIRGLNYQSAPFVQAKVVSCVAGAVYSVGVDITPDSSTFGQWCGWVLTPNNHRSMVVPRGYAHGFVTMQDNTELQYLTDNVYSYDHAKSIRYDDPDLDIDWTMQDAITLRPEILSSKNRNAPFLRDAIAAESGVER
ncbi:dTDP-4-dehydrorhamnose 3,5-epimerase family protein [Bifidobacterium platyrrhinorum]|uniref:dTDP-4-dehydrorhamnose 3,5-epimerase family protein n=1 Tax=Bifidobacterium platyrrhinorum TaxID=2661628 RepID=UPI0013D79C54|nr:dTDP-4-dehydrorhamnose 3,5-epimerase [Bifidobacterium platyrrhinorum]